MVYWKMSNKTVQFTDNKVSSNQTSGSSKTPFLIEDILYQHNQSTKTTVIKTINNHFNTNIETKNSININDSQLPGNEVDYKKTMLTER